MHVTIGRKKVESHWIIKIMNKVSGQYSYAHVYMCLEVMFWRITCTVHVHT